jgi:hypothetical protein
MRWRVVSMLLFTGCAFHVPGVDPGPSAGGGGANDDPGAASAPASPADLAIDDGGWVPQSSRIGDPCDDKMKVCATGQVCETKSAFGGDIPGGYCSMDCRTAACPSDSQCSPGTTIRLCLLNCPVAGCRAGYICCKNGWLAPGVCLPAALCPNG